MPNCILKCSCVPKIPLIKLLRHTGGGGGDGEGNRIFLPTSCSYLDLPYVHLNVLVGCRPSRRGGRGGDKGRGTKGRTVHRRHTYLNTHPLNL